MRIFVDTSALYAVLDRDDPYHQDAVDAFSRLMGAHELVTHNYVQVEAEQLVRRRLGSKAAGILIDEVLPGITTMWVDEAIHASALAAMRSEGRAASLVDQVSFLLMRRAGIEQALAFDGDFAKHGFTRPERPDADGHRLSEQLAPYGDASVTPDLVSLGEIAELSGRSVNTIQSWRRRHADFPAPYVELRAGPIWSWSTVSTWIARRGQPRRLAPRQDGATP